MKVRLVAAAVAGVLVTALTGIPAGAPAGAAPTAPAQAATYQPRFPGHPAVRPKGLPRPAAMRGRAIDGLAAYDGQRRCIRRPQPGTVALAGLLQSRFGAGIPVGLNRACQKDTSEHYDGRAIDWMVDSAGPSAQAGDDFVKWLTMTRGPHLGAMAQRLGVMYVIWRNRIWKSYQAESGWQEYSDCLARRYAADEYDSSCHRNHVHVSLSWAGARQQTSWWTD